MRPYREKPFTDYLTLYEDRIDVMMKRVGPRVVAFSANYRAFIAGRWRTVFRADTSHGRLHIHRFWHPHDGEPEFKEREPKEDYTKELKHMREHIFDHWQEYRAHYECGLEDRP